MIRTFVIGDCHGNFKGLQQCIERSGINKNKDKLICLGDVADGYPQTKECFDELLTFRDLVYVMGNHDLWLVGWMLFGTEPLIWVNQGGKHTIKSYGYSSKVPASHIELLQVKAKSYYVLDNRLYVHGGLPDHQRSPSRYSLNELCWDRDMLEAAFHKHKSNPEYKFTKFDEVFVGHTTTFSFSSRAEREIMTPQELSNKYAQPLHFCNIWDLDTGGGWKGKITMMNVETKEFFQSDLASELYPNHESR